MPKPRLKVGKAAGRRAVAYLRKSSDQQEASIERQRDEVFQYATRHKYDLAGEYVDAGVSGVDSTDRRPGFQQLVADAEKGAFDYVIVWDLSRLSRSDAMETAAELRPLRRAGVRVVTTDRSEPLDWDTFAGQLMFSIEAEGSNAYVRKLARNTLSGQARKAAQGRWVAGKTPLGYARDQEDRLVLGDPYDVETVQQMFKRYAAGESFRGLIPWLRTRGIDRGVSWIRFMLQNPVYAGDWHWGKTCQAKFYTSRQGEILDTFERGETDQQDRIIIVDNHPAIVDRQLFNAVQSMFAGRRRGTTPLPKGGGFVLSGLLRCADCGYQMVGRLDKSSTPPVYRYQCNGAVTRGDAYCHKHFVTQDQVITAVLAAFEERFSGKVVERARKQLKKELAAKPGPTDARHHEKEIARINADLDKAAARLLLLDPDMLPIVQKQIRKMHDEVERHEKALLKIRKAPEAILKDFDERVQKAEAVLAELKLAAKTADTLALRQFLKSTIKEIRVHVTRRPYGKRWRYTFTGGDVYLHQSADLINSW